MGASPFLSGTRANRYKKRKLTRTFREREGVKLSQGGEEGGVLALRHLIIRAPSRVTRENNTKNQTQGHTAHAVSLSYTHTHALAHLLERREGTDDETVRQRRLRKDNKEKAKREGKEERSDAHSRRLRIFSKSKSAERKGGAEIGSAESHISGEFARTHTIHTKRSQGKLLSVHEGEQVVARLTMSSSFAAGVGVPAVAAALAMAAMTATTATPSRVRRDGCC